jgi:hypothetical protein
MMMPYSIIFILLIKYDDAIFNHFYTTYKKLS